MKNHFFSASLVCLIALSACATPREEISHFKYAALSTVRDFNVSTEAIPEQLRDLENPYGYTSHDGCEGWYFEALNLKDAIQKNEGRRVGYRRDGQTFKGRLGNIRDEGVKTVATNFTPYRGLVRQFSGAAAYDQKAQKADQRARERFGFLIGLGRAHNCRGFQ